MARSVLPDCCVVRDLPLDWEFGISMTPLSKMGLEDDALPAQCG
jgi:hypothetical protein